MTRVSARVRANRLNAARSTGPTSLAGKAVASRNALTHGLCVVGLPEEERRLVEQAAIALVRAGPPSDEALSLASAMIELRRVAQVRARLLDRLLIEARPLGERVDPLGRLQRYERRAEAALRKAASAFDRRGEEDRNKRDERR